MKTSLENGTKGTRAKRTKLTRDNIKKIARELYRTATIEDLAESFGCPPFAIVAAKKKLVELGIKFPEPSNAIADAIADLRKSDPDLFKAYSPKDK